MRLLVSIHDVTPAFARQVEGLWDVCAARSITPALFVVPSWHGEFPLEDDPRFCAWLRRCKAAGAEIFLHGERHDEVGSERSWRDALRAFGRTNREGEFLTLTRASARNRIARGIRRLRALGLDPVGFVAPAWLARRDCLDAVADVGLRFSEDTHYIHLHDRATRVRVPVIRWSARTLFRAHASVAVAAWTRNVARHPLMRVALHPRDLSSRPVRRSVLRTLDDYLGRARPTPYCAI